MHILSNKIIRYLLTIFRFKGNDWFSKKKNNISTDKIL